jgi:integrase
MLHEVDAIEFKDFVDHQKWMPKTYNEFLRGISILYREAQFRRWAPATCNPTAQIKRLHETAPEVGILKPKECKQLLDRLTLTAPDLVPAIAIWAFSGIRIEEIGRVDWPQIRRGLETGMIVLEAGKTKKLKKRSVPVIPNLRIWLTRFCKQEGYVFPGYWLTPTKTSENRLSELPRFIRRKTGCRWCDNWGRHSFGTYYFKMCKDPGQVVKVMGNSLKDFERDYWNKADEVTDATATEWFGILPEAPGNLVTMPDPQSGSCVVPVTAERQAATS